MACKRYFFTGIVRRGLAACMTTSMYSAGEVVTAIGSPETKLLFIARGAVLATSVSPPAHFQHDTHITMTVSADCSQPSIQGGKLSVIVPSTCRPIRRTKC